MISEIDLKRYQRDVRLMAGYGEVSPTARFAALVRTHRPERAARLRAMAYPDYLKTAYWRCVRDFVLQEAGQCQECHDAPATEAHHLVYDHIGEEHAFLHDLLALCRACHEKRRV